jgi:hypothetical protein
LLFKKKEERLFTLTSCVIIISDPAVIMNIVRKFRAGGASTPSAMQDEANSNPQHTALGLMHLKKLFSEYSHPSHPLSEKERDDKLYNMLPLFCKVRV